MNANGGAATKWLDLAGSDGKLHPRSHNDSQENH